MYNHAQGDYECPFCKLVNGEDNDKTNTEDIFYQNKFITAFIAGKWWINNPGGTIIIPNKHFENIYDIDEKYLLEVVNFSKRLALALKEVYKCDGVSTRQHNEPAGNQDIWHFHYHVMPRYKGDELYKNHDKNSWVEPEDRKPYAEKLRKYFNK